METSSAGMWPLRDDGWGPVRAARRARRLAGYIAGEPVLTLDADGTARMRLELSGTPARAAARAAAGRGFAPRFGAAAAGTGRVLALSGSPEDVARAAAALPRLVDYTDQLATLAVRTLGEWTRHSSAAAHVAALTPAGLRQRTRDFRAQAFATAAAVLAAPEDQAVASVDPDLVLWEQAPAIAAGLAVYGWVPVQDAFDPADVELLLASATTGPAAEQLELPLWDTEAQASTTSAAPQLVVVIPCSGRKLPVAAAAGEIYTGSLHTHARRTANALTASGGTVLVLSARYGLLTLDQQIEPYEHTWADPGHVSVEQLQQQAEQLGLTRAAEVVLLTPGAYTQRALAVWPDARTPLAHLGIGRQRGRLTALRENPTEYTVAA
ncbi:DUF6884 domain-containing protein [Kitasatospora griseola]|uniref:DUF6884 domain-containing protein n=1 Tax=Kitasatospora griseola TaxID=2064 RepID=UPI0036691D9D